MFVRIANLIEANQQACHFYSSTGIKCPGCGVQTSIIEFFRGNLWESILAYPALLPIIFTLIWGILFFLIFKQKKGKNILLLFIAIDIFLILFKWICQFC